MQEISPQKLTRRFRSKEQWPIRRLYRYMKGIGVNLGGLRPFECFREEIITAYLNSKAFRCRKQKKSLTSRLSKASIDSLH